MILELTVLHVLLELGNLLVEIAVLLLVDPHGHEEGNVCLDAFDVALIRGHLRGYMENPVQNFVTLDLHVHQHLLAFIHNAGEVFEAQELLNAAFIVVVAAASS